MTHICSLSTIAYWHLFSQRRCMSQSVIRPVVCKDCASTNHILLLDGMAHTAQQGCFTSMPPFHCRRHSTPSKVCPEGSRGSTCSRGCTRPGQPQHRQKCICLQGSSTSSQGSASTTHVGPVSMHMTMSSCTDLSSCDSPAPCAAIPALLDDARPHAHMLMHAHVKYHVPLSLLQFT